MRALAYLAALLVVLTCGAITSQASAAPPPVIVKVECAPSNTTTTWTVLVVPRSELWHNKTEPGRKALPEWAPYAVAETDAGTREIRITAELETDPKGIGWINETVAHEIGHTLTGAPHRADGFMREGGGAPFVRWPSASDLAAAREINATARLVSKVPAAYPRIRRALEWGAATWSASLDRDAVVVVR
jgi:hypothetical protein